METMAGGHVDEKLGDEERIETAGPFLGQPGLAVLDRLRTADPRADDDAGAFSVGTETSRSPLSSMARSAATTANWAEAVHPGRRFRSIQRAGSKPRTSAAMVEGKAATSNRVRRETPFFPDQEPARNRPDRCRWT